MERQQTQLEPSSFERARAQVKQPSVYLDFCQFWLSANGADFGTNSTPERRRIGSVTTTTTTTGNAKDDGAQRESHSSIINVTHDFDMPQRSYTKGPDRGPL